MGAAAPFAVVGAVGAIGFTSGGIAAGSMAASMMSSSAIASGGGVAAGGVVATLQSCRSELGMDLFGVSRWGDRLGYGRPYGR